MASHPEHPEEKYNFLHDEKSLDETATPSEKEDQPAARADIAWKLGLGFGSPLAGALGAFFSRENSILGFGALSPDRQIWTLVLVVMTIWWWIDWFSFAPPEGRLLQKYLNVDHTTIGRYSVPPIIYPLIIAAMFGPMMAFTSSINIYSLIVLVLLVSSFAADSWVLRIASKQLFYPGGGSSPSKYVMAIRDEIFKYYFDFYYFLWELILILSFAAAFYLSSEASPLREPYMTWISYSIPIAVLAIHECIKISLRNKRSIVIAGIEKRADEARAARKAK